jgi:hypothetical protein
MEGLTVMYETKNFLSSLPWIATLSLFSPSSQQSRISEECGKDVNFMSRKTKYGF